MGNTTSIITPQKFQEQVFSLVLYHVAPKANSGLKLIPEWEFQKQQSKGNSTADCLPLPDQITYQNLLDFYSVNDPKVMEYLEKHVLNSEENLTRFYRVLIAHLETESRRHRSEPATELKQEAGGSSHYSRTSDKLTRSKLDEIESRQPSLLSNAVPRSEDRVSQFTKCHIVEPSRTHSEYPSMEEVESEVKRQLMEKFLEEYSHRSELTSKTNKTTEKSTTRPKKNTRKTKPEPEPEPEPEVAELSEEKPELKEDSESHSRSRSRSRERTLSNTEKSEDRTYPKRYVEPESEARETTYRDEDTLKYKKRFGKKCMIDEE